jgi:predicted  nucleic acid-binding Zn-ribbon protein
MAITRQLYQLEEYDTEIEQDEQSLSTKTAQLGDRTVLDTAQKQLAAREKELEELRHRHRDAEAEVDDLLSKIADAEGKLYGGKITNPKELSSLQHEVTTMKAHGDELENHALEIIEQVETAEKEVAAATADYGQLEKDWQARQKALAAEIEQLKASLADLRAKRQQLAGQIDGPTLTLYERIRQQKRPAVAKVEQGICRACRISLSASVLQRARGGQPVQCGTCGRILFIS